MSVGKVIEQYLQNTNNLNEKSKLYSAIGRYVAPSLGHPYPENAKRLSKKHMLALINFLKNLSVDKFVNASSIFENNIKGLEQKNIYPYRTVINNFIHWCNQNRVFEKAKKKNKIQSEEIKESPIIYFINREFSSKEYEKTRKGNQSHLSNIYALMATKSAGELVFKEDYINEMLNQDIRMYKKFRKSFNISDSTIDMEIQNFMRLLGWFHRVKNIPLENLRFTSLIYYYPLYSCFEESLDIEEFDKKNLYLRRIAFEKSSTNINAIEEFFENNSNNNRSKELILLHLINLSKFIFKNEIARSPDFQDYSDLFIIRKLRKIVREIPKHPTKDISEKIIPWCEALEVLEILRHNASATHTKKAVGKKKITLRIKSRNLLYFLCVAFSMLIPPDRPDALVSLQINSHDKKNNSLLLGILKNGKFTFKENMDNPEDAKWYIHLVKYKTKKTYGEYWSLPIPNIKFRDGKLFYDYIEDWLKNKRNYNNECNHNYFFRRQIDLEPMTPSDWYTMISTRFINYTFKAIDSTTLRHMYVTELRNRGATDAEKIAAAYAMHHSLEIANNVYNEQEQYEIMIPSENKHMEILSHILE